MKRIYDKQPREHRKRSHYNSRGIAKLSFINEQVADKYIKKNVYMAIQLTTVTNVTIGT